MTPEEAIEMLRGMQNKKVDYAEMVCAPAFAYGYEYVYPEPEDYAIEEAIKALKEIQQYREIGTVEEVERNARDLKRQIEHSERLAEILKATQNLLEKREILLKEYCKIGTVEECRAAVEKQKPKKPYRNYEKFSGLWCRCGWYLGQKQCLDIKYCPNCGQAIDENLEGMEDE